MPRSELTTKDGKELDDLLSMVRRAVDIYREAEEPFREMFSTTVNQQTFMQDLPEGDELYWDKIAEGEHPRTVVDDDDDGQWMTIRGDEFAKGLGFTRKYIRKSTSEEIMRKVNRMLEGASNTKERLIIQTFKQNLLDGSTTPWYNIPDYGEHTFADDHQHVFGDTDALFDADGNDDTAYSAHKHLRNAKRELTHHGFSGPFVALTSTDFLYDVYDEVSWDANYHVPMATGMRSSDVSEIEASIEGVNLIEADWMTGKKFWLTQVDNEGPVKFYPEEDVTVVQPNEAAIRSPGDLLGAKGYATYGARMVDPLRVVKATPTNVK
jgi:hypothetical protein